jgi:ATP-dependent Clp protease ATP-binding subunit ClpC
VIELIVRLAGRYITERQFPDKAIDVLDELGSEKRISTRIPESIEKLKFQIDEIKEKKIQVVKSQNYEQAAKLRDEIKDLENNSDKIKKLKKEMELAIEKQDFERAIEIRDELKTIN